MIKPVAVVLKDSIRPPRIPIQRALQGHWAMRLKMAYKEQDSDGNRFALTFIVLFTRVSWLCNFTIRLYVARLKLSNGSD